MKNGEQFEIVKDFEVMKNLTDILKQNSNPVIMESGTNFKQNILLIVISLEISEHLLFKKF